jgi:serine/threonine protein phosphatase PrpC
MPLKKREGTPPNTSFEDMNIIEKDIKFSAIGKRTLAGAKNGYKKSNQDSIFIDTHILGKGRQRISVFAVFDGHGQYGDRASRFLIGNLKSTFVELFEKMDSRSSED